MENTEKRKYTPDDLRRYEYGWLAAELANSKDENDQKLIPNTLELLAENIGIKGSDAKVFVEAAINSREGIKRLIEEFGRKHQEARAELTIKDIYHSFGDVIRDHVKDDKARKTLEREVNKYGSKRMGDVDEEIEEAKYLLNDKYKYFSEKQKEEAQKELIKYRNLKTILNLAERVRFNELKGKAEKKAMERTFNQIAEYLGKPQKEREKIESQLMEKIAA